VWEAVRDRVEVVVHEAVGLRDTGPVRVRDGVPVDVRDIDPVGLVEDNDGVIVVVRVWLTVLLPEPWVADDGVAVPLRENVSVRVMLCVAEGGTESVTVHDGDTLCDRTVPVRVEVRVGAPVWVGGDGLYVELWLSDALPGLLVRDVVNGWLEVAEAEGLRDNVCVDVIVRSQLLVGVPVELSLRDTDRVEVGV